MGAIISVQAASVFNNKANVYFFFASGRALEDILNMGGGHHRLV